MLFEGPKFQNFCARPMGISLARRVLGVGGGLRVGSLTNRGLRTNFNGRLGSLALELAISAPDLFAPAHRAAEQI